MDFSKFLDDDFNVTTWVNDAFRAQQEEEGSSAQSKRDIYAATLVTKLQVFIQEVNKSLEEMSTQVVNSMPRVLRDIEALKQEASYLKQQMQQVKEDIHDVEKKTSHTMKVLVQTDQVRNRVEKSCAALREADNWSSLAAAIEDVFRTGDSNTIAVRLQSMQNSLDILKDSPDYDDKVMHLEALKNRLESNISPQAVAVFRQHSTEEAKSLQTVFSIIGREKELHKYYIKTYNANLITQWQEIVASDEDDDKIGNTIMNELFDLLLSTWHSQIPWCKSVFGPDNATLILMQLLNEVLLTAKPGIFEIISTTVVKTDEPKMLSLVQLHETVTKFALGIGEAVEAEALTKTNEWTEKSKSLIDALWIPFITFQANFKEFETDMLLTKLSEVVMDAGDLMDLTRVLNSSADKIFTIASEAVSHCETFTNFLGSQDLIGPLNTFFHNYSDKFSRALRTVNMKYGLNEKDSGDLDITEEHYYSLFQHSLRIITTCGKLLQSFSDFEQRLVSDILGSKTATMALTGILELESDQVGSVSEKDSNWKHYNYLIKLDIKEYRKLQDMLVGLKQSPPSQRSLLPTVKQALTNLNQQAHQLAFDIAFAQIKKQLAMVPQLEIWSGSKDDTGVIDDADLPAFSLPPTEYATTVGQLLMTLPQHLEPLAATVSEGGHDLSAMETALHTAKLPFSMEEGSDKPEMENMADRWLSSIVRASEHTYVEACLQIPSLTSQMSRQLAADLDYMGNVVDSLGLPVLKDMSSLIKLLRAQDNAYSDAASDVPKKIVSGVARARGIKGH